MTPPPLREPHKVRSPGLPCSGPAPASLSHAALSLCVWDLSRTTTWALGGFGVGPSTALSPQTVSDVSPTNASHGMWQEEAFTNAPGGRGEEGQDRLFQEQREERKQGPRGHTLRESWATGNYTAGTAGSEAGPPNSWTASSGEPSLNYTHDTGGKHKALRPNPALHLISSHPAPCFYPAAALSSRVTVKEQLHVYSPNVTFGPLKATGADVARG